MAKKNLNTYHEEILRRNGFFAPQEYLDTKDNQVTKKSDSPSVEKIVNSSENLSDDSILNEPSKDTNNEKDTKDDKFIKTKLSSNNFNVIKTKMKKYLTPEKIELKKVNNDNTQYNAIIKEVIAKTHLTDLDKDNIYNLFDRVDDLYNQRLDAINSDDPDLATSLLVQMDLLLEKIENNTIKEANHAISKIQKLKNVYCSSSFFGSAVHNAINYAETLSDFYQNRFVVQYKNLRKTEYVLSIANKRRREYGLCSNQIARDYLVNFSQSMEGKAIFDVDNVVLANFYNENMQVVKRDDIKSVWAKKYKVLATDKSFMEYGKESILILLAKQYDVSTDKVLKIMEDINFGKQNRDVFIRNLVVANGTAKISQKDMEFVVREMASISDFEYNEFLLDIKDDKLDEARRAEMTDLNEEIINYKSSQRIQI